MIPGYLRVQIILKNLQSKILNDHIDGLNIMFFIYEADVYFGLQNPKDPPKIEIDKNSVRPFRRTHLLGM